DWQFDKFDVIAKDGSKVEIKNSDGVATLYISGDSTVKNGKGRGDGNLCGWGSFLGEFFDTSRLAVRNYALGGRSSRNFITEGHWDKVLEQLKPGDYVLM